MKIRGIHHIKLTVSDLARTVGLFGQLVQLLFGLVIERDANSRHKLMIINNFIIAMSEKAGVKIGCKLGAGC